MKLSVKYRKTAACILMSCFFISSCGLGLTGCNSGKGNFEPSESAVNFAEPTASEATKETETVTPTSTPTPSPTPTPMTYNVNMYDEFHLYTDWDHYQSSVEANSDIEDAGYDRLYNSYMERYCAKSSDGYVYPFVVGTSLADDGKQIRSFGLVDESGTVVCDGVYDGVYFTEEADFWICSKNTHSTDPTAPKSSVCAISYNGQYVYDNGGAGYSSVMFDMDGLTDTAFCIDYEDGECLVNIFDYNGNNLSGTKTFTLDIDSFSAALINGGLMDSTDNMPYFLDNFFLFDFLYYEGVMGYQYVVLYCYFTQCYVVLDINSGTFKYSFKSLSASSGSNMHIYQDYFVLDIKLSDCNVYDIYGNLKYENAKKFRYVGENRYLADDGTNIYLIDSQCNIIATYESADDAFAVEEGFCIGRENVVVNIYDLDGEFIERVGPSGIHPIFINSSGIYIHYVETTQRFVGQMLEIVAERDYSISFRTPGSVGRNENYHSYIGENTVFVFNYDTGNNFIYDLETGEMIFKFTCTELID